MFTGILYALHLSKLRWDSLYPNAKDGDEPTHGIMRVAARAPCQVCGRLTSWKETVTNKWICSLRCRMNGIRAMRERTRRTFLDTLSDLEKQIDRERRTRGD
jgi:hypothetical protein